MCSEVFSEMLMWWEFLLADIIALKIFHALHDTSWYTVIIKTHGYQHSAECSYICIVKFSVWYFCLYNSIFNRNETRNVRFCMAINYTTKYKSVCVSLCWYCACVCPLSVYSPLMNLICHFFTWQFSGLTRITRLFLKYKQTSSVSQEEVCTPLPEQMGCAPHTFMLQRKMTPLNSM